MTHRNCGGMIEVRDDLPGYYWDDGSFASWPYFCKKCGREILGDNQVIIEGIDDE